MKQVRNERKSPGAILHIMRRPRWRVAAVGVTVGVLVFAQSVPKEKPSDYPVHQKLPAMELAAEYLVHSIPGPRGVIFAREYLVIEVAAYPASRAGASWKTDQFTLRINGKKNTLLAQAPGMVAASLKYPDWIQRPRVTGTAGVGAGDVIIGEPTNPGRFPGDPNRTASDPIHRPPQVPEQNPSGQDREPVTPPNEVCLRLALQDGEFRSPTAGLLYFPFDGKLKSIRRLELIYEGPGGERAILSLL